MVIQSHPVVGKQKSFDLCDAFYRAAPIGARGHVFYGVNDTNLDSWRKLRDGHLGDWYYIDNSYFDKVRGQQYRITKNRVQVDPSTRTSDGKRFAALGIEIKPWAGNFDGHELFVGQSEAFMRDIACAPLWAAQKLRELAAQPREVRSRPWGPNKKTIQETLLADLKGAHCLITYSSAAAVTALIEGIPVFVEPMSALHGLRWINGLVDDRLHYLSVLADNQFTIDEMKSGKAWACLNDR